MSGATTRERRPAAPHTARVVDADRRRARATEELLGALAPALGLDLGALRVRTDEEAAAHTRGRGARGLAAGGAIWLDPARYDPLRADGRALLAHEAAHVAQRAETRLRPDRGAPSLSEAEREAAAVAEAVLEGRMPPRPRATLPAGALAADTGTAVAEPPAPAQDQTTRDPLATYRGWSGELDALVPAVRAVHGRRIAEIADTLDGLWISDGDVANVLTILEPLPYEQAAAIVRALSAQARVDLAGNVSSSHRSQFRTGVLATYAGLLPSELALLGTSTFDGMPLDRLSPEERFLAVVILLGLSHETMKRLLADSVRAPAITTLMQGPPPDTDQLARERGERRAALETRREAEAAAGPAAQDRIARLQAKLRRPSATDAREALDELAGMLPAAAPAVEPATPAEATEPPTPAEPAEFRVVVEALEQTGAVDRMIRALLEIYRTAPGPRRDAFVAVIGKRTPDANVRLASDLLGNGLFNWISDEEARLAYDVIRALPLDARDRFLRRDEGVWLERLEDNLPADVLMRADYIDLAVVTDDDAARTLWADSLPTGPGKMLSHILDILDRGAGTGTTSVVLKQLVALTPEVRQAVVGRLDTLGRFDAVLDDLGDHILLAEDSRADVATVLAARDARHLERHIRRLLRTNLLDWAVTSREAYLAFLMWRELPPADRERFGRLDEIVGELTPEMRASAGLHVVTSESAADQRADVRERLADELMWDAERAPELRALIHIAVALGERGWAFEQSELRRAWEDPALNPIVEQFELYNPIVGRTRYVPGREEKGSFLEDVWAFTVLRAIGRIGWFVASEGFKGTFYVDPWAGQAGTHRLSLLDLQQAAGGELGGATVSQTETEQRYRTNELTVTFDDKAGTLDVVLPALELASVGQVAPSWSLRTGPVSARGIKVHADFANGNFAYPSSADIGVVDLTIADILASSTDGLSAVTRVHLGGFGAHGDLATLAPSAPRSHVPGLMLVPLLGPLLETIRLLIRAAAVRNAKSGALLQGIRVELASFEVEGVALPGDQQAHSLAVTGIKLGWGATRAQYLRLLIESLDKRAAAATEDAERARLTEQLEAARRELTEIEPAEQELIALLQRMRQDPESLTADDHRRLVELQQQGPGGVVVETGPITIRGVGGAVAVREIAVEHVIGHGETAALTLEVLTDEALLRRFTREGPPTGDPFTWSGELDLGDVTAVDIVYEGEIPSQDDIVRERDQLVIDAAKLEKQPDLRARVENRIGLLDTALELRTELDELAAVHEPTRAQLERRRELRQTLARHFGIAVDLVQAGGARITGRGDVTEVSARTLEVSKVASDVFAVDRVTGTGVAFDYSLSTEVLGFRAEEVQVRDVRTDELGSTIASVDLRGLKGTIKEIDKGARVEGLEIVSMTLGRIDWGNASKRVTSSRPVTVTGLTATVEATWTGEGAEAESLYAIKRLDIQRIEVSPGTGPGLVYEDLASGLRAELFAGAVEGVWAQDFAIRMGKETTFEAASDEPSIGFKRFDALRFGAAFGQSFQVGGTLSSPAGMAEDALGITFVGTDSYAFDLRSLTLTDGLLTTPDGSVRIVRLPMSGRVTYASRGELSDIGLEDFTVPDMVLGAIDWKLADGSQVTARGRTELRGITATAGVHRDAKGLARATVTDLRIDAIGAEDLRYAKGSIEVRINRPSAGGRPPLDARDIHIRGLTWERGADEEGHLTSGTVDVGEAGVGLEAKFASGLATGSLHAQTINVSFFPGDRLTAEAEAIDATVDLAMGAADRASIGVTDVGARIEVSPERIRIEAGAIQRPPLLYLPRIHIPTLDFEFGGVLVALSPGGAIDLEDFTTGVTIDLRPGDQTPKIKRITIDELDLGLLTASRLRIDDPANGLLDIPDPTSPARLEGIRVRGLALDQDTSEKWTMAGYSELHADAISFDWIEVGVEIGQIMRRNAPPPGTPSKPYNPAVMVPFEQALNSLDGQVNFDMVLPIEVDVLGGRVRVDDRTQPFFPVRIAITKGVVDVAEVIDVALDWELDHAVDFDLHGSRLALNLEVAVMLAAALGPLWGPLARRYGRMEIASWTLTTGELARLPSGLNIDLRDKPVPLSVFRITQFALPPGPSASWLHILTDQMELNNIDGRLSMINSTSLPIKLPGTLGTLTLAPFALQDMRITGDVPGLGPGSAPFELGIDSLEVESMDLDISGLGRLTTSRLLLGGLTNGRMTFTRWDQPERFDGRIARFRWRDVSLWGTPAP